MTSPPGYSAADAQAFYDAYGDREWTRFHDGRTSVASLEVHRHYLRRFITPGMRVLEIGAGPGRFTIELAAIGARITVADLSEVQLVLNVQRVAEAGAEAAVEDRVLADIVDLSRFADAGFDAVVCYGGPLSYVLERADEAVGELLRVLRPGGLLLVSVMSLVGSTGGGLPAIAGLARTHGVAAIEDVLRTGDLPSELSGGHLRMHLFRWTELEGLLTRRGDLVVAVSASSVGPVRDQELFADLSGELREAVVRWQVALAAEPGAVDSGAHIIAVVQRAGA